MRARRRRIAKRLLLWLIPWLMVVAGLVIVGVAVFSRLSVAPEQQRLVDAYRAAEQSPAASVAETPPQGSAFTELPNPDAVPEAETESPDSATLAVLTIPSIGLEVAVREGVGSWSLKYTVGHYPLSVMPGESGNCVIMGHRNYTYGEFFNRLNELAAGDTVVLERAGTLYSYTVTKTFVVEPADTWVLDPDEDAVLTLITCTPIRVATHRLIVRCTLTGTESAG